MHPFHRATTRLRSFQNPMMLPGPFAAWAAAGVDPAAAMAAAAAPPVLAALQTPAVRAEVASILVETLDSPAFRAGLAQAFADLVTDPAWQTALALSIVGTTAVLVEDPQTLPSCDPEEGDALGDLPSRP